MGTPASTKRCRPNRKHAEESSSITWLSVFELPLNCSIHVKWSSERIAGFTDGDELLHGAPLLAWARTCGAKSSAAAAKSNGPNSLVAFLLELACLLTELGIASSLAFVYSVVDMKFIGHEQRQPPRTQHNPIR